MTPNRDCARTASNNQATAVLVARQDLPNTHAPPVRRLSMSSATIAWAEDNSLEALNIPYNPHQVLALFSRLTQPSACFCLLEAYLPNSPCTLSSR